MEYKLEALVGKHNHDGFNEHIGNDTAMDDRTFNDLVREIFNQSKGNSLFGIMIFIDCVKIDPFKQKHLGLIENWEYDEKLRGEIRDKTQRCYMENAYLYTVTIKTK